MLSAGAPRLSPAERDAIEKALRLDAAAIKARP
jgi:hypothetical protein